jgi:hypothetical protein
MSVIINTNCYKIKNLFSSWPSVYRSIIQSDALLHQNWLKHLFFVGLCGTEGSSVNRLSSPAATRTKVGWASSGCSSVSDWIVRTHSPWCIYNWVRKPLSYMPLDRGARKQMTANGRSNVTQIDLFSGASALRSFGKSDYSTACPPCPWTISWTPYLPQY